VVLPGHRSGQLAFPLQVGLEPGSLCSIGGQAAVTARVAGVTVEGSFSWTMGRGPLRPAEYEFRVNGAPVPAPPWAVQLPTSMRLVRRSATELERDRARLVRRAQVAECRLLRLTEQVLESCCRGPLRFVLATHGLVDESDLIQRGLQVALRLLPVYASARRPPRTWLGMIHLDAKRDMHRAVSDLDWLPRELTETVYRARQAGIALDAEPDLTRAALLEDCLLNGRPLPRVSAAQVHTALTAPVFLSLDARPLPDAGLYAPDPRLDDVDDQPGRAAATVAALVSSDPTTVSGVFEGDPRAVQKVAERVVARISQPAENRQAVRERARRRFLVSGQLLTREGFPAVPPRRLAALDDALRQALDLEPVA
jgi:hypothetical protein